MIIAVTSATPEPPRPPPTPSPPPRANPFYRDVSTAAPTKDNTSSIISFSGSRQEWLGRSVGSGEGSYGRLRGRGWCSAGRPGWEGAIIVGFGNHISWARTARPKIGRQRLITLRMLFICGCVCLITRSLPRPSPVPSARPGATAPRPRASSSALVSGARTHAAIPLVCGTPHMFVCVGVLTDAHSRSLAQNVRTHAHIQVHVYVCMFIYMYIYNYVYVHTYIHA